jgi:hydrogenase maturation protein HypF
VASNGLRIHITGIVQGVGFRPFVYGLAQRLELTGWVRNTSAGVEIEVDGRPDALSDFTQALQEETPALAQIDDFRVFERPPDGYKQFEIVESAPISGAFQPISADVCICPDCLKELFDPSDRRYRYPFINCTNCGPRFTIIEDIPYDRPLTTMAPFEMCLDCAAEYQDPLDRRFHAQPVACPVCGPQVWLEDSYQWSVVGGQWSEELGLDRIKDQPPAPSPQPPVGESAIQAARELLRQGKIVAVKGLGGFHLACDATNPEAVSELRRRKLRVDKPFALMMANMESIQAHCQLTRAEQALLESRERPIVILERLPDSTISVDVAPGQHTLGVMLPYTPLHHLLLEPAADFPEALVMTSGNLSEEPIATGNDEARNRLSTLAHAYLLHNRGIRTRCDDSVVRVYQSAGIPADEETDRPPTRTSDLRESIYYLRRSRGYAPNPIRLPWESFPLLAAGAELKNTFCLANGRYAFISHHIGDMENYETMQAFEDGVTHFERLFRVRPEAIAYDLHPNYLATRYALERAKAQSLPAIGVQHHHAHIAACMADQGLDGRQPVIGVSFDGTGYGDDGAIWGGEFLVADYASYRRTHHLAYVPLPGGDKAIKEPWRVALSWLEQASIPWEDDLPSVQFATHLTPHALDIINHQIKSGINAPPTSSIGRLFDAVSALVGVRQTVNYEAQAAIELEAIIDPAEEGAYHFEVNDNVVEASSMLGSLVADLRAGTIGPVLAARFHNGLAQMVLDVCSRIREAQQLNEVALSGGVWQNITLLDKTVALLQQNGFRVYLHRQVPTNDGGLALGQAVIAAYRMGIGNVAGRPLRERGSGIGNDMDRSPVPNP